MIFLFACERAPWISLPTQKKALFSTCQQRTTRISHLILQQKVAGKENMPVTVNHAVKEYRLQDGRLDTILVEDRASGEVKEWQYDGVFVFIGLTPNRGLVKELAEVDRWGFIETDKSLMTRVPGLFAAGDVRAGSTKQAASAAGEGSTAALMIRQYLQENS